MFNKYQHVERFGNSEVRDIELGTVHVFPKLDGTNASVWVDDEGAVCAGSRNRQLTPKFDNAGFHTHVCQNTELLDFMFENPGFRLYGEWLVPHAVKGYRDSAWKQFYVFDVTYEDESEQGFSYVPYDRYQPLLDLAGIELIPRIAVLSRPTYEQLLELSTNAYLMDEGQGEGIVIKRYDFFNKYGRQTWAKIVTSEFKENKGKNKGPAGPPGEIPMVEQAIADEFVTLALCEKVKAKIEVEMGDWSSKYIGRLLQTIYYDVVREESWTFIKKHKNPTINFKTLQTLVTLRIKHLMTEIF